MQTCSYMKQGGPDQGGVYLTVAEGSYVKIDRHSNLSDSHADYVIYTQLSGIVRGIIDAKQRGSNGSLGNSGASQMGVMRMVSAIDVQWVAPLMPKLKDSVDVKRLSTTGQGKNENRTTEKQAKDGDQVAVKRQAGTRPEDLEAEVKCEAAGAT